jgi:hypothetical protein
MPITKASSSAVAPGAKGELVVGSATNDSAILSVGSTNQTILADSTQTTGIKWAASPQSLMTATGDTLYASAANTPARLGIGSNGQFLTTNGVTPSWGAAPSSEGFTLISSTSLSGTSVTVSSIPATYKHLMIVFQKVFCNSNDYPLKFRLNSDSGANYNWNGFYSYSGLNASASTGQDDFFPFNRMRNEASTNLNLFATYWIYNYTSSTNKGLQGISYSADSGGTVAGSNVYGNYNSSSAITSVTAIAGGVNFSGGTMYVYGVN